MRIEDIVRQFQVEDEIVSCDAFGSGHINDTLRVRFSGDTPDMVLQKINVSIFPDPYGLMENAVHVTDFLREKLKKEGRDYERGTLAFVPTKDGRWIFDDGEGGFWRMSKLVPRTMSYDLAENAEMFRSSGQAFGQFMADLNDFPAKTLHEVIPNFHNTVKRFETFRKSLEKDVMGRADSCREEIEFVLSHEALCHEIVDRIEKGILPLRVTHNDTKINNILMDSETGESVCIVDLDTVMPGSCLYDFGDSIRFGATHALEDETDLSKVDVDPELFKAYTEGYLSTTGDSLTAEEKSLLVTGAMVITFETGMRFLTDHLDGDVYFKIAHEGHNLDRARTQFKLVRDMEEKRDLLEGIVKELC